MIVSDQFKKITMRHKRIGYNKDVMRQTACRMFCEFDDHFLACIGFVINTFHVHLL